MYIVTVEFVAKAQHVREFREALLTNASASRERESGCRQFDVGVDPDDPRFFFLYEVYDDRAAFDAHVATEHFLAFDADVRDWVERKSVRIFGRIGPAQPR